MTGVKDKVVHPRAGSGAKAKGTAPSGTIGLKRITTIGNNPPSSVPLGNESAKNVGKGGPGAGRTIHSQGSQSHGTKE